MINIHIDELTNSIKLRETGEIFETQILPIMEADIQNLFGWSFDWQNAKNHYDIYKLTTIVDNNIVQGLIAIEVKKGFIFIELVENAPFNIGFKQIYRGVGGNLFAFACKLSFELGFDGYVSFVAKTELIEHYREKMFAKSLSGQRMVIETDGAKKLVNQYFSKEF
jgi:hypothetical protein